MTCSRLTLTVVSQPNPQGKFSCRSAYPCPSCGEMLYWDDVYAELYGYHHHEREQVSP